MDDQQLMRYARHILLENYGIEKQRKIMDSHVLIIGLGGLGSSASMYLASSGIGEITLLDNDTVDISNLQRQILHNTNSIGNLKVDSAKETLLNLNPEIKINTFCERLKKDALYDLVNNVDVVLDCSDNFETRYLINNICFDLKKILVSGAAIRFNGQVSVYDFRNKKNPCYNCIFPHDDIDVIEGENCATTGVFAPLVGVIGNIKAAETIKILANIGDSLIGKLFRFNILTAEFKISNFTRDEKCIVCHP